MTTRPVIPQVRSGRDVRRGMESLRGYFKNDVAEGAGNTTPNAQITVRADNRVGDVQITTMNYPPLTGGSWTLFGAGRLVLDVDAGSAAQYVATTTVYLWIRTA